MEIEDKKGIRVIAQKLKRYALGDIGRDTFRLLDEGFLISMVKLQWKDVPGI